MAKFLNSWTNGELGEQVWESHIFGILEVMEWNIYTALLSTNVAKILQKPAKPKLRHLGQELGSHSTHASSIGKELAKSSWGDKHRGNVYKSYCQGVFLIPPIGDIPHFSSK